MAASLIDSATVRRPTAELAHQVFVAHVAPDSKTGAFARQLAATGKPLLTLDGLTNANLVGLGALMVRPADALD